jgi:hypothetical protein
LAIGIRGAILARGIDGKCMARDAMIADDGHGLNFRLVLKTLSAVTPPVTRHDFWHSKH